MTPELIFKLQFSYDALVRLVRLRQITHMVKRQRYNGTENKEVLGGFDALVCLVAMNNTFEMKGLYLFLWKTEIF